jgi:hypothetical protein
MSLTPAQLQTLKTAIQGDATLAGYWTAGSPGLIADFYNLEAAPAHIVWKSNVSANDIGNAWVGTDIDGMSALNMQRLQLLLASSPDGVYDMRRADRRAGFENPFGTNANNASRVAMRSAWKRNASNVEKLFATGTGSDASPATTSFEGNLDFREVIAAMGA